MALVRTRRIGSGAAARPAAGAPALPTDVAPLPVRPWLPLALAAADPAPIRRCTYRRLTVVTPATRNAATGYAADCLYPRMEEAIPLGDLERARGICAGCTATGIFRPDED
ncbi:MAG: hypothetical protein ACKOTZ_10010 [Chloroflexota bacterium]